MRRPHPLRRRQGEIQAARELLEDVWEPAERGPYPLFGADAYNVLAAIERETQHGQELLLGHVFSKHVRARAV